MQKEVIICVRHGMFFVFALLQQSALMSADIKC